MKIEDAAATTTDDTTLLHRYSSFSSVCIFPLNLQFPRNFPSEPPSLCIYSVSIRRADYVYWMSLRCSRVDKGRKGVGLSNRES